MHHLSASLFSLTPNLSCAFTSSWSQKEKNKRPEVHGSNFKRSRMAGFLVRRAANNTTDPLSDFQHHIAHHHRINLNVLPDVDSVSTLRNSMRRNISSFGANAKGVNDPFLKRQASLQLNLWDNSASPSPCFCEIDLQDSLAHLDRDILLQSLRRHSLFLSFHQSPLVESVFQDWNFHSHWSHQLRNIFCIGVLQILNGLFQLSSLAREKFTALSTFLSAIIIFVCFMICFRIGVKLPSGHAKSARVTVAFVMISLVATGLFYQEADPNSVPYTSCLYFFSIIMIATPIVTGLRGWYLASVIAVIYVGLVFVSLFHLPQTRSTSWLFSAWAMTAVTITVILSSRDHELRERDEFQSVLMQRHEMLTQSLFLHRLAALLLCDRTGYSQLELRTE